VTKPPTKAELAQALRDRENTVSELNGFLDNAKSKLAEYDSVLVKIMAIHKPYVDTSQLVPCGGFKPVIVLRCGVCKTPEHHTRAELNDEMWPCPTLQLFVITTEDAIEAPK
jgi:hypothetical protein